MAIAEDAQTPPAAATDAVAAEARRLVDATTPGPWFFDSYGTVHSLPLTDEYHRVEGMIPEDAPDDDPRWDELPETVVSWVPRVAGDTATKQGAKDALFIGESRQMVPALLASREALIAALEKVVEAGDGAAADIASKALSEARGSSA